MTPPLVSIVIPTYNRAGLIGETLDSIIAQTYPYWECIVVDDGSTDNTSEVIGQYINKDPRFKYYQRPEAHKAGGNGARNFGFLKSEGDYLNWFDSDDFMVPQKLELKVQALEDKEVDFVVGGNAEILSFDPYRTKKRWEIQSGGDPLLNHLKSNIAFTTPGPMFKTAYLRQVDKLFDEEVRIGQEWDFYSRLLANNPKYICIPQPLYHFRTLDVGIRSEIDINKYLNRCQTEIRLFKYINSKNYFKKGTALNYEYQQFKFYWSLRRFHFLRHNLPFSVATSYLLKYIKQVEFNYLLSNARKGIFNRDLMKSILQKV